MPKMPEKDSISDYGTRLGELQRKARSQEIPIIIVFEGLGASGKGTLINKLILPMDARGFKVYSTLAPTEEEKLRPFLWRFWIKTPSKGRIAVFDRSWYRRVLTDRIEKNVKKDEWLEAFDEIKAFERQLTDGGTLIIKFLLQISKKEQKRRFKELENDPAASWRVTKADWKSHRKYDKYAQAMEEMVRKTSTPSASWNRIDSSDYKKASLNIFEKVIHLLEERIDHSPIPKPAARKAKTIDSIPPILNGIDLSKTVSPEEYASKIRQYQKTIRELEYLIYLKRIPVVICFEGCDAAGKGGNIRRLLENLDPRGYEVVPVGAPSDIEKSHHYLWRFWNSIPKAGHITLFDRTWYGRVLVERVEGFCSQEEWRRAYREISEMEEQLVHSGCVVLKFWLQIDKEEQLRRFHEREKNPEKNWKITDEDYRNREKWDQYVTAVNEMIYRTSTETAPWTIVESNSKHYARLKVLETVIAALKNKLKEG